VNGAAGNGATGNGAAGNRGLQDLDPDALLSRVTELGVLLRAEGDSLCYDAPSAVATPELLTALRKHRASLVSSIKAGVERRAPATFQQRRLIASQQVHGVPQVFNVAMRITFRGPLNVTALRAALSALVARHESLRTRYTLADDEWCQEVLRPRPVDLGVHDLTTLPYDARDAEIERVSARLADAPFDLRTGPEPVFRLLRAENLRWVLLFVLHHGSCDGWGLSVLLKDFAALYAAEASGRPDGLERPMQPAEYALWQRDKPVAGERRLAYWSRQLEGARFGVDLPTDRPRPSALSGRGDVVPFRVSAEVRTQTEACAQRHGTTPFAVTAAAYGILLSRLSGQQDVVVSVPYANREQRAHENLVACTATAFGLRIRVAEAKSFSALVEAVARDTASAISNIMPMSEIAAGTGNEDIAGGLEIGFQYRNAVETEVEFPGMTVVVEELAVPAARREFSVELIPTGDVLSGHVEYSTDLWDRETIEQWVDAYRELLREVVTDAVSACRSRSTP
jgi:iturin family lipopeptide synthetase A